MSGLSDRIPAHCAHRGQHGAVCFAQVGDGTFPAEVFWNSLNVTEQAKFAALFGIILSDRRLQIANKQQFNQIEGALWEFKRNDLQMRMFTFRHGNTWYLVCGMRGKKEDDLPPGEVKRAMALMAQAKARLDPARKGRST